MAHNSTARPLRIERESRERWHISLSRLLLTLLTRRTVRTSKSILPDHAKMAKLRITNEKRSVNENSLQVIEGLF